MIIRAKYRRGRKLKYISHLDIMRVFIRAIRRSEIDIVYSKGFNKRIKIIFSMALSVGLETKGDYFDIELKGAMDGNEFKDKINKYLPEGLSIEAATEGSFDKNIMSLIEFASYEIILLDSAYGLNDAYEKMMKEESLIFEKQKQGKIKRKDIKKGIYGVKIDGNMIYTFLSSGQKNNVKPEEFIEVLNRYYNEELKCEHIIRKNMYIADEKNYPIDPVTKERVYEKDIY